MAHGYRPPVGVVPTMPLWLHLAGMAITSFVLSGVMSAVMVAVNIGLDSRFVPALLVNWALGFVVSFPVVIALLPPVIRWQMLMMQRRR